jgi:hypothetical protein
VVCVAMLVAVAPVPLQTQVINIACI